MNLFIKNTIQFNIYLSKISTFLNQNIIEIPLNAKFKPRVIKRIILILIIQACFLPLKNDDKRPNNIMNGTVPQDHESIVSIPFNQSPEVTDNNHILFEDAHGKSAVNTPAKKGPAWTRNLFFFFISQNDGIPVWIFLKKGTPHIAKAINTI